MLETQRKNKVVQSELKKTQSCKNLYRIEKTQSGENLYRTDIMYERASSRGYCHAISIQLVE